MRRWVALVAFATVVGCGPVSSSEVEEVGALEGGGAGVPKAPPEAVRAAPTLPDRETPRRPPPPPPPEVPPAPQGSPPPPLPEPRASRVPPEQETRTFATACSRTEYFRDGSRRQQVFGTDGVLRDDARILASGTPDTRIVQQVAAGRVLVRDEYSPWGRVSRVEWTYGEHGEPLRREAHAYGGAPPDTTLILYSHDSQGRLEREELFVDGFLTRRTFHTQGAHGPVRVIVQDGGDPYIYSTTEFTYHSNGQRASEQREGETYSWRREWDAEGRELLYSHFFDESSHRMEQHHDSQGRLSLRLTRHGSSNNSSVREERFEYDADGRLVLRTLVGESKDAWTGETRPLRETVRFHYDARGFLVLEDEEALSSWRRSYTRDAAGNVLEERLEGSAYNWLPARIVYTYECFD